MLSSLHQRWHDHTERAHIDFTPLRSVLRILVAESKRQRCRFSNVQSVHRRSLVSYLDCSNLAGLIRHGSVS